MKVAEDLSEAVADSAADREKSKTKDQSWLKPGRKIFAGDCEDQKGHHQSPLWPIRKYILFSRILGVFPLEISKDLTDFRFRFFGFWTFYSLIANAVLFFIMVGTPVIMYEHTLIDGPHNITHNRSMEETIVQNLMRNNWTMFDIAVILTFVFIPGAVGNLMKIIVATSIRNFRDLNRDFSRSFRPINERSVFGRIMKVNLGFILLDVGMLCCLYFISYLAFTHVSESARLLSIAMQFVGSFALIMMPLIFSQSCFLIFVFSLGDVVARLTEKILSYSARRECNRNEQSLSAGDIDVVEWECVSVVRLVGKVNATFGRFLVLYFFSLTTNLIYHIYSIITYAAPVLRGRVRPVSGFLSSALILCYCVYTINSFVTICEEFSSGMRQMWDGLHCALVKEHCRDKQQRIKWMMTKVSSCEKLSASGYFVIDKTILTSIFSSLVTYLIVLMQFKVSDNTQK